jgi:hypothetical protein
MIRAIAPIMWPHVIPFIPTHSKRKRLESLGAYKATSGPALDAELHLLPVQHQIWKTSAETVSRIIISDKMSALAGLLGQR